MTLVERFDSPICDAVTFRVSGCLTAEIHGKEMRSVADWHRLIFERVAPMVWLSMPVHDVAAL